MLLLTRELGVSPSFFLCPPNVWGTNRGQVTSFIRLDGSVWTTDKDGIIAAMLAAAPPGWVADPGENYRQLTFELSEPIGGLKMIAENGWFAARPSGTENIYKIYAESFRGADHLRSILEEAQSIIGDTIGVSVKKKS
jgi:phosphoglucomutase